MFTMGATPDLNWSETDYVYGPDYVDEFAFLINANGKVRYVLQDANYNAVVLARDDGVIVAQYTYGPYRDLRAADWKNPSSPATAAIGHQRLRAPASRDLQRCVWH